MSLKGIARRIERLEHRADDGECDGCNLTVAKRMERGDNGPDWIDWSSTDLACCPDCNNPNPRISIRFVRALTERLAPTMTDTTKGEDS